MRVVALGAGVAALAACSSGPETIKTETIDLQVGPHANDDNAVAVDLVLVFDPGLVAPVAELTAATWFTTRDQVRLANPTGLEVQSFELIPGQPDTHVEIDDVGERGSDAVAAFLFAGYGTPGPHRARIDGMPAVLLRLGGKDFAVSAPSS